MRSIMQDERKPLKCYLCGSCDEHLDRHHCLQGGSRRIAEKYGLVVYLCHNRCHLSKAHREPSINLYLKQEAQRAAMREYAWSVDDWRKNTLQRNFLEE